MLFYLAGPITGLPYPIAKAWRRTVSDALYPTHSVLDPLRFDQETDGPYLHRHPALDGMKTIVRRNYHDLLRCDALIVNCSQVATENLSIGTLAEVSWAYSLKKPTIVILPGATVEHEMAETRLMAQRPSTTYNHPYFKELADYIVPDVKGAIEVALIIAQEEA